MPFVSAINKSSLQPIEFPGLRRAGNSHDGGYVVPLVAVQKSRLLLSFGLSWDWTFERDIKRLNPSIEIQAYDHTVSPGKFARAAIKSFFDVPFRWLTLNASGAIRSYGKLKTALDYFRFFKGEVKHFQQRVWYNGDRRSAPIGQIIQDFRGVSPCSVLAKVDIEGSEYRILPYIIDQAEGFSALLVEFHDVDICAGLFNRYISQLSQQFYIVHLHGNNSRDLTVDHSLPNCLEITFLNKELVPGKPVMFQGKIPREGLDSPNNPDKEDYEIRF
jgi:hypothetical protein